MLVISGGQSGAGELQKYGLAGRNGLTADFKATVTLIIEPVEGETVAAVVLQRRGRQVENAQRVEHPFQ